MSNGIVGFPDSMEMLNRDWTKVSWVSNKEVNQFSNTLKTPALELRLFSSKTGNLYFDKPDLYTKIIGKECTWSVDSSNRLLLSWNFTCDSTSWYKTRQMLSIDDLYNAVLCVDSTNNPETNGFDLYPTSLTLTFEHYSVDTTNFGWTLARVNTIKMTTNYTSIALLPPATMKFGPAQIHH